jgi:long-chain acyl-CoA synthetase
MYMT